MANVDFLQLTEGEGVQLITVLHENNITKTYVSHGNDYEGLTPDSLGEGSSDNPIQTVVSVECAFADSDHEINVNNDFDGTVEFPALSIVAWELIGTRPATRPHK